jgi:GT2 family glycosyltransferase
MKSSSALISVITVNYNQSLATCEMLDSVYASGYPNLEVIVVDNNSQRDDPAIIPKRFPGISFIQSAENLGFAGGNNLAISASKGEYIYLLNNDTVVPPGHFDILLSEAKKHESDVVCPKIKFYAEPDMIQFAGYTELTSYTFRNQCIGYGEKDSGQHDKVRETAYAHGAAMMLKREVIEKTGLMNEHYFLYYEELDWSARIKRAGYRIIYIPATHILHKESISTGKNSPLQVYYLNRNRLLFVRCNESGMRKLVAVLYQLFVAMPKNIILYGIKGLTENMKAVSKAWWWNIRNIGNPAVCKFSYL